MVLEAHFKLERAVSREELALVLLLERAPTLPVTHEVSRAAQRVLVSHHMSDTKHIQGLYYVYTTRLSPTAQLNQTSVIEFNCNGIH
jgi:hypothetical protein